MGMQRAGGVAGLLHAAGFLGLSGLLVVLVQAAGFHSVGDVADPAKMLPAIVRQPWAFAAYASMTVLVGATTLVLALALHERLGAGAPSLMRAATITGIIAAALFVAQGVLNIVGLPEVAARYTQNRDQASGAFFAFQAVADGLLGAATVAYGAWLLMMSWAGIRLKSPSRGPHYLGFIWGLLTLLAPFDVLLAGLQILGPIWGVWMGISLLREARSGAGRAAPLGTVPGANGQPSSPPGPPATPVGREPEVYES